MSQDQDSDKEIEIEDPIVSMHTPNYKNEEKLEDVVDIPKAKKKVSKVSKKKSAKERIQVNVRLRPYSQKELSKDKGSNVILSLDSEAGSIVVKKEGNKA